MACVENIPPLNGDSEMEEGEIVDDLSDISSEEEFLLRQRLQVLENYNNVLERKKAKRSSVGPGSKYNKEDALLYDLSEISATELEDYYSPYKNIRVQRHQKTHHRQKRKKEEIHENHLKNKEDKRPEYKKKNHRIKRKLEVKIISESSESEDEYRNRRRKLADAVVVNKEKNDKTSLSERLQKMLCGVNPEPIKLILTETNTDQEVNNKIEETALSPVSSLNADDHILNSEIQKNTCELIDLCNEDDSHPTSIVDPVVAETETVTEIKSVPSCDNPSDKDSDEDLELLRQHALKTKTAKAVTQTVPDNVLAQVENKPLSEDEDSDTAELRLICLKSALLKKAIEMKRKQKLKKRLSQSSNLQDDLLEDQDLFTEKINSENNTDIESVDMDMGSDVDEKCKDNPIECAKTDQIIEGTVTETNETVSKDIPVLNEANEDELEEDEDLLRAKLLTSLSKNLPNLVNPSILNNVETVKEKETLNKPLQLNVIPEEKRFIINLGDSDSEGEHEATKNLTKMHMKLSEQVDFQKRLDIFLKSTRMEIENKTLPDVVQEPTPMKKNEKFVAKAVKHLPKSVQLEYKNLVKRMAELEKIKQARQSAMNINKMNMVAPMKETLKPRNVTIDASKLPLENNVEEQIRKSRKNIAEESAKMLKLKDEGTKLSQKYKIVATELRNIKTAIALNKKQQRTVQNYLTKIRLHHQMLLKSSMTSTTHSKINGHIPHLSTINTRLQKENNPNKEEYKNPAILKTVKVSVVNDVKEAPLVAHPRLSVQVDVSNDKKIVNIEMPDNEESNSERKDNDDLLENTRLSSRPLVEKGGGNSEGGNERKQTDVDDYRSPLDAFGSSTWEGDPNAILCPFEVGGDCKDADCKYLHTNAHPK